jgi:cobalt-zinc-cadmium efflux system outer membrane protein
MHLLRPFLGLACLLAGLRAHAQPTTLTLADALRQAEARNPALLAEGHLERAAEARIDQAGVSPASTLELNIENVAGTGRAQGVRGIEATLQASRTFERGKKRTQRIAFARRDREVATAEFSVRRAEVIALTAQAFTAVLAARERLVLTEDPVRHAQDVLASVEGRVNAGDASPAESARARAVLAAARAELARAEADFTAARAALAATWGGKVSEVGLVAGALKVPANLPPTSTFLAALPQHPQLVLQAAIIARQKAAVELEQTRSTRDVTASSGVRFLGEDSDAALVAGVSVPFSARNQNAGNLRAARADLAGAEQRLHAIEAALRTAITAAWQEAATAHQVAATLRADALPASEEAHTIVRRAYEAGELPLIDVLDAERELTGLRRAIFDAEFACITALVRTESLANPALPYTTTLLSSP